MEVVDQICIIYGIQWHNVSRSGVFLMTKTLGSTNPFYVPQKLGLISCNRHKMMIDVLKRNKWRVYVTTYGWYYKFRRTFHLPITHQSSTKPFSKITIQAPNSYTMSWPSHIWPDFLWHIACMTRWVVEGLRWPPPMNGISIYMQLFPWRFCF